MVCLVNKETNQSEITFTNRPINVMTVVLGKSEFANGCAYMPNWGNKLKTVHIVKPLLIPTKTPESVALRQ